MSWRRMNALGAAIVAILLFQENGHGQTLVGIAYSSPSLVVAPGQIVPVLMTGLKTILPTGTERAQSIPLPLTLAGVSVTFAQTPQYSRSLPLAAIQQFNQCAGTNNPASDCLLTAITVQIPFDIVVPNPLIASPFFQPLSSLEIFENGVLSKSFIVSPVPDQIHMLQSCDITNSAGIYGSCYAIVTHADGSLVLQAPRGPSGPPLTNSEAHPGETLVMYAFGLGSVSPAVQAGSASPAPAATVISPIYLQFDYRPNASPSAPMLNSSLTTTTQPVFAGLTPGQVGLYQINFVVPAPPAGTQVCGAPVESNLTISVTTADGRSLSGAAICVDTGYE